jgi:hypothetical protein
MARKPLLVGNVVAIKGGKYKGERGTVVKLMRLMMKVKLESSQEEVNVYQTNVESTTDGVAAAINTESKPPLEEKVKRLDDKVDMLLNEIQQHLNETQQMKDELHQLRQDMSNLIKLLVEIQSNK